MFVVRVFVPLSPEAQQARSLTATQNNNREAAGALGIVGNSRLDADRCRIDQSAEDDPSLARKYVAGYDVGSPNASLLPIWPRGLIMSRSRVVARVSLKVDAKQVVHDAHRLIGLPIQPVDPFVAAG